MISFNMKTIFNWVKFPDFYPSIKDGEIVYILQLTHPNFVDSENPPISYNVLQAVWYKEQFYEPHYTFAYSRVIGFCLKNDVLHEI